MRPPGKESDAEREIVFARSILYLLSGVSITHVIEQATWRKYHYTQVDLDRLLVIVDKSDKLIFLILLV